MIDYFTDYTKGESYAYGLKCTSPVYNEDVRDVIHVGEGKSEVIKIVHDTNSRRFVQIYVGARSDVKIEIILIAKENMILDSYVEIIHEGDAGKSELIVRGYTEASGRIISRVRTYVPHEVWNVTATQDVSLYQFGAGGIIDCIPVLEVQNKTTQSHHAVRFEKISDIEYWYAAHAGISSHDFQDIKKKSLSV